jgi:hypothetical protein
MKEFKKGDIVKIKSMNEFELYSDISRSLVKSIGKPCKIRVSGVVWAGVQVCHNGEYGDVKLRHLKYFKEHNHPHTNIFK